MNKPAKIELDRPMVRHAYEGMSQGWPEVLAKLGAEL